MADKVGTSIAVLGLIAIGSCYMIFDGRLKESGERVVALETRLATADKAAADRASAIEARLVQHQDETSKRSQVVDERLDDAVAQASVLESRLAATDQAAGDRARLLEERTGRLEDEVSRRGAVDAAEAAARKRVLENPGSCIKCESVTIARRGIVNAYSRVTQAKLHNESEYAIADIRGNIEYRSKGRLLGTVPATATGLILAGKTVSVSVTASEIVAAADEGETVFVVTSVAIVGGR